MIKGRGEPFSISVVFLFILSKLGIERRQPHTAIAIPLIFIYTCRTIQTNSVYLRMFLPINFNYAYGISFVTFYLKPLTKMIFCIIEHSWLLQPSSIFR